MAEISINFKFRPQDHVNIPMLSCAGRCVIDAGPLPLYGVDFVINGECKRNEFYEDELEAAV